jgi:hypothetical protein
MDAKRKIYLRRRRRAPLAVRARFEWTFFSTGLFATVILFCCGAYLLTEAISDPPDPFASGTVIVTAGFILSLASFLLTYLVWPRAKTAFARSEHFHWQREVFRGPVVNVYRFARNTRTETSRTVTDSEPQIPGPM